MNPIKELKTFLSRWPSLELVETESSIAVLPQDFVGFKVLLKVLDKHYMLSYGKWHEYLPKDQYGAKVAIGLFKFGLTDSCKLTIYEKGNADCKCCLSYKKHNGSSWIPIAKQKALIYPFWKKEKVRELRNDLLSNEELPELFESEEFEKVIAQIKYEQTYFKYTLSYSLVWTVIFLKLNNFDFKNIIVTLFAFTPVILFTLVLPLLIMRNWFDDRKYGKRKKINLSNNQKKFLFIWISFWFTAFLVIALIWGVANLIPIMILGLPFIIVVFCIPIYLLMD